MPGNNRPPRARRPIEVLQEKVDALTGSGKKCISVVTESVEVPGEVYMLIMACPPSARCGRCDDARSRLRKPPAPPTPTLTEEQRLKAGTTWLDDTTEEGEPA